MNRQRQSEQGFILLFVMVIILVISIYGIASLDSSDSEMMIARNHRCYKQNVYCAEVAVLEAAYNLETESEPADELIPWTSTKFDWLFNGTDYQDYSPEEQEQQYQVKATEATVLQADQFKDTPIPDTQSRYAVRFEGIAEGNSLKMGEPTMWQYEIYGQSQGCQSNVAVVSGYRRFF